MYRIFFITTVALILLGNTAMAQAERYVSTGWCRFQQGEWGKEWVPNSDAGFTIDSNSREIRFDHTTWASHTLKIDRTENSSTPEGIPLITYYCTEPANGDKWEVRFNEWTVFDESAYYHYYLIEIKNPSASMRFMTKKAE
ncbi:MAG: hypothetical protein QUS66_15845 [Bacteroidota bacterium]|nr:hypothetical protein [Bacteroidota bacterium]